MTLFTLKWEAPTVSFSRDLTYIWKDLKLSDDALTVTGHLGCVGGVWSGRWRILYGVRGTCPVLLKAVALGWCPRSQCDARQHPRLPPLPTTDRRTGVERASRAVRAAAMITRSVAKKQKRSYDPEPQPLGGQFLCLGNPPPL